MQSVNNDMDDLFRRAAENYPLKTDSADWNKVMQGLEPGRREALRQKKMTLERYFWMAAIFLVVICTTFIQKTGPNTQADHSFRKTDDHTKASDNIKDDNNSKVELTNPYNELNLGHSSKKEIFLNHSEQNMVFKGKSNQVLISNANTGGPFLIPSGENTGRQLTEAVNWQSKEQPGALVVENRTKNLETIIPLDTILLLSKDVKDVTKDAVVLTKKEKKSIAQKIYATFVAGPDVSTVKSQRVNDPGYSVGVLAGYQFNKSLSVETGVLWAHKDYYSEGKHFDKTGLGLPQHARILDVDGYCDMFEIPVNLKFNWVRKSSYQFFATAGASSYLMKKEKYDYSYMYYGNQYDYYKNYNNASRNWTSILNLSIGYEKKIGNAGSIRIEPYLKVPLKGVGVGNLPIGSKGVLIGFSRPLH